jgi:hypothetical protein
MKNVLIRIRDRIRNEKMLGFGSGIKYPGSATLLRRKPFFLKYR